jgi:LacI family transcriptional regulator
MSKIAKISEKTGLAISTVAGVLRNAPGFSSSTRDRVMRVAEELGYRPNFLSKALAGGKSMTIGVLGCWLTTPSIAMKLESIEATARKAGYLCYLASAEFENAEAQVSHLRGLLDRRVDGLIADYVVVPPPDEVLELLRKCGVPHVFMDWAPQSAVNRVTVNRVAGFAQAAKHLASLGHRRVAYVSAQYDLDHPAAKADLYRRCIEAEGMKMVFGEEWSLGSNFTDMAQVTYEVVKRQLSKRRANAPTALILVNDTNAIAAIRAAQDLGLNVPGDVSIVGFDDLSFAAMTRPSLTTVRQPRSQVGEMAFASLLKLMQEKDAEIAPVDLACELIVRESTGSARH